MSSETVAPRPIPASVDTSKLSESARQLLLHKSSPADNLVPYKAIPKTPEVAAGAADLAAMFASSLTPEEVAFHTPVKPVQQDKPEAPKSFLQAHMIIIDTLLMDPAITTTKLAAKTGYSRQWLHKVMSSDAFQAKLAERQAAIIDPIVHSTIKERVSGLVSRSLEVLEERMESDKIDLNTALTVFEALGKSPALGLLQKQQNANINNFVVHVPAQMVDVKDWAKTHGPASAPAPLAEPLDITPTLPSEGEGA